MTKKVQRNYTQFYFSRTVQSSDQTTLINVQQREGYFTFLQESPSSTLSSDKRQLFLFPAEGSNILMDKIIAAELIEKKSVPSSTRALLKMEANCLFLYEYRGGGQTAQVRYFKAPPESTCEVRAKKKIPTQ